MKYFHVLFIVLSISIISCKLDKVNNSNIIETKIIELNEEEIMVIEDAFDFILNFELDNNFYNSEMPIYVSNILFVNNDFEGDCQCFDEIIEKHEYSYEHMVKNSENVLIKLNIDNALILSFINNNFEKFRINENTQFKSNILLKKESTENNYLEITFSNIGFNDNRSEALIHTSIVYPNGFGKAKYMHLVKDVKSWKINNFVYAWIGG